MSNLKTFDQAFAEMYRWYAYRLGLQNNLIVGDIDRSLLETVAFEIEQESYAYDQAIRAAIPEAMLYALDLPILSATAAQVALTFSRSTPAQDEYLIPAGTRVQTTSGVVFETLADSAIATGAFGATVTARCTVTGVIGNIGPGTATLLSTLLPGIEAVTNGTSGTGGTDPESATGLLNRVASRLTELARGTIPAITLAALRIRTPQGEGASAVMVVDHMADPRIPVGQGNVYLYRPGGVSSALLVEVLTVLEAEQRPIGISLNVLPVNSVPVTLAVTVNTDVPALVTAVQGRAYAFFDALSVGEDLNLDRLHAALAVPTPGLYSVHLSTPAQSVPVGPYDRAELTVAGSSFVRGSGAAQ